MNATAGRCVVSASIVASRSSEKSDRSGTATCASRASFADSANIAKPGTSDSTDAPSRATAIITSEISSSEPLPSSTSQPSGTRIARFSAARSASARGDG